MKVAKIKKQIGPILKQNGVIRAGIFGSVSRGEATKRSDIDLLVQLKRGSSLLDLVRIERELALKLRRPVDLLTYKSIHHLLKKKILTEEKRIYEKS